MGRKATQMVGRVVVIGAGMGGLASAAQLSARGYDVTVIEKEEGVGGKARRVQVEQSLRGPSSRVAVTHPSAS